MHPSRQERFRPLILRRLAEVEQKLAARGDSADLPVAGAPEPAVPRADDDLASHLRQQHQRLANALRRLDLGAFGRCIRCGSNLPETRLEQEPDALTCDPCPPRGRKPQARQKVPAR